MMVAKWLCSSWVVVEWRRGECMVAGACGGIVRAWARERREGSPRPREKQNRRQNWRRKSKGASQFARLRSEDPSEGMRRIRRGLPEEEPSATASPVRSGR